MASTQVTPTRMELTRTKKKLVTAIKGHKLLKDKRDELMRQFLDLVKVNMELREKVEAGIRSANKNFVIAKAGMDEATLNTALMAPKQEVDLEVGQKNVMSVDIPVFETKTRTADANDIYSYGFAFTSSDLDGAVKSLADILPDMLKLAETEKACQLMAAEIEKTRRRVNALEHVIIPEAQKNIKRLPVTISRCSNNYGPYHFPEKLIPLMISRALADESLPVYGTGENVRDWLHVSDHCEAIDLIIHNGRVGEVYNVGGHNERTNLEVVKTILKALHKPESLIKFVTDRPGHDRRYAIDPTKLETELGWKPKYNFDTGIQQTIQWYLDNEDWWKHILSGEYSNYFDNMYGKRLGEK